MRPFPSESESEFRERRERREQQEALERADHEREAKLREEFLVNRFKDSHRNIGRLLRSSGAPPAAVAAARGLMEREWGRRDVFERGDVYGRAGVPLLIVSYPFQVKDDGRGVLDALTGLGLAVDVTTPTPANGHNTRVVVAAPDPLGTAAAGRQRARRRPDPVG